MLYGDEKVREMSRSLLPSTARQSARKDREALNRKHRRTSRQAVVRDPGWMDDAVMPDRELRVAQHEMVQSRRAHDHVNGYIRWATQVTKDLSQPDRLSHIRASLPEGVIGMHAASHLEFEEAFRNQNDPLGWWRLTPERKAQRKRKASLFRREIRRRVTAAYEADLAGFNRFLKRLPMEPLRSWDDIEGLVDRICNGTLPGRVDLMRYLGRAR